MMILYIPEHFRISMLRLVVCQVAFPDVAETSVYAELFPVVESMDRQKGVQIGIANAIRTLDVNASSIGYHGPI